MRAELIAVGTELLLGEIVDTNTAWLATDLADRGVDVLWSQRVGDNLERIAEAIHRALERNDLVVACGGLGPTADDLTREAVCRVVGEEPSIDSDLERELRAWFEVRARPFALANLKQAWRIPSAESLPNRAGTAPGWLVRIGSKLLITLPGPPGELKPMWSEQALPRLDLGTAHLARITLKTWGAGESAIAERLGELAEQGNPSVATYAREDGVHVRVAAKGADAAQARALLGPTADLVRETLRDAIWGSQDDSLVGMLHACLLQRGWSLSSLESLTGGFLGNLITREAGISDVYLGGGVAYSPGCKVRFGVPAEIVHAYGTVSPETAAAMAEAAAAWFGSDVAVALTGVAGPSELEGKAPGTVFASVKTPHVLRVHPIHCGPRGRNLVRESAAWSALHLLRAALEEI